MGNFNRQTTTLLGSEFRPTSARNIVLNSTVRAVAQRFVPGNVTPAAIDLYLAQILGTPGLAVEIVDTLTPTLDTVQTVYPGTATGATSTSWVDEQSTPGAAAYTDVAKKVAGANYLRPNTTAAAELLFRGTTDLGSTKRVVSIRQGILISYPGVPQAGTPGFFYGGSGTAAPPVSGILNIGGVSYQTGLVTASPNANYQVYTSTPLFLNPSTGLPWTLTEAELLTNGTDEFGVSKAASIYTLEHRLQGMWLDVTTCAENRRARYYSTSGQTLGWQRYTLAHPDGGAISALSASTYYYLVVYLLNPAGGSSLSLPALTDTNLVLAASASASTGDFRQTYTVNLSSGIGTSAEANPGELMAAMLENPAGTFNAESNPYVDLAATTVSTGPSQQVTATNGIVYRGIRLAIGWESAVLPPDAPLVLEVRKSSGAETGGGTLVATATIPASVLLSGGLQDYTAPFDSSATFTAETLQYHLYAKTSATSGRRWVLGRLDTGSNLVSTISAANVQGTSVGGTTDSYADTAGVADDRFDIPMLLVPSISAPASLTATVVAATATKPAHVALAWTPPSPALGTAFGGYVIERRPRALPVAGWSELAVLDVPTGYTASVVEAQHIAFEDYDVGRGITGGRWAAGWQYRVTAKNATTGLRTPETSATTAAVTAEEVHWLTSNAKPWLNQVVDVIDELTSAEDSSTVYDSSIAGRDYALIRVRHELPARRVAVAWRDFDRVGEDSVRLWKAAKAIGAAMALHSSGDRIIGALQALGVKRGELGTLGFDTGLVETNGEYQYAVADYNLPAGLILNGTSQRITHADTGDLLDPASGASGAFSVVMCAQFGMAASRYVLAKRVAGDGYALWRDGSSQLQFLVDGASASGGPVSAIAGWNDAVHVAVGTSSGTAQNLYRDVSTTPVATSTVTHGAIANSEVLSIGALSDASAWGAMSPVVAYAVYLRELTATDAQAAGGYLLGVPGYRMPAGAAVFVDLRDDRTWSGTQTSLVDLSGNALTGTVVATPSTRGIPWPLRLVDRFA